MPVTIKKKYLSYNSAETQEILDHAVASLPKADSAVQYYSTETTTAGQTSKIETIGGKTIATSGDTTFVIQPRQSIQHICGSNNHDTYIIGIDGSTKTILKESNFGEVNWTNDTDEAVTVQVGCLTVGDSYTVKVKSEGLDDIVTALNESIAAKYTKPVAGIPDTDLKEDVQLALTAGSEALQFEESSDPASLFDDSSDSEDAQDA